MYTTNLPFIKPNTACNQGVLILMTLCDVMWNLGTAATGTQGTHELKMPMEYPSNDPAFMVRNVF